MKNLGKLFSEKKVAVKVKTIENIVNVQFFVHEYLYEDVSLLLAKLQHKIYEPLLEDGCSLSVGLIDGQVEVHFDNWFINHGYEIIDKIEFIENLKEW